MGATDVTLKEGDRMIRLCRDNEFEAIYAIVNEAAEAYKGIIPPDRWQEPYMSRDELQEEIRAGVTFWGYEEAGELLGVMGIQPVRDVTLIRHAYVRPAKQRQGIGAKLLAVLSQQTTRPLLVGTWADAAWAIRFYQQHGFRLVSWEEKEHLLREYWSIPARQVETSVVLANSHWPSV
jgi:N-acetylglutamate synthase-like GNAT family acetyltransferase